MQKPLPKIDGGTLVGLACRLGVIQAMEFAEFAHSCEELDEAQKKLLFRGWLAIEHLPKDASLEASDLHKCLTALRQAWCRIKLESGNASESSFRRVHPAQKVPEVQSETP